MAKQTGPEQRYQASAETDDLAMDNWMDELDLTRADIQDLWRKW